MEYISILPEFDLSHEHRYLRLPHPRTGQPQLYLPTASQGKEVILEVSRMNGSRRRTWFVGDSTIDSGTVLVHHPVDPLFLVIPIILSLISNTSDNTRLQPLSDLISTASSSPSFALPAPFTKDAKAGPNEEWNEDVARLLQLKSVRRVFRLCCEKKVILANPPTPPTESASGSSSRGQAYYRPSLEAVLRLVKLKIEWFAHEDRWGCFDHNIRGLGRDGLLAQGVDAELITQTRLKTTIEHFAQYLPPSVLSRIQGTYDFSSLGTHLANMSAAALAASMPPTNLGKKGDKAAAGAKRKGSAPSRGVESLKKVNTSSMAKMTSFFKPKDK